MGPIGPLQPVQFLNKNSKKIMSLCGAYWAPHTHPLFEKNQNFDASLGPNRPQFSKNILQYIVKYFIYLMDHPKTIVFMTVGDWDKSGGGWG